MGWKDKIREMKESFWTEDLKKEWEYVQESVDDFRENMKESQKSYQSTKTKVWDDFLGKFHFSTLGEKLWESTKSSGKEIWQSIEDEMVLQEEPSFSKVREKAKERLSDLSEKWRTDFSFWMQEEFRRNGFSLDAFTTNQEELKKAYNTLGVEPSDELEVIQRKLKVLMRDNHPDLYMHDPLQYEEATQKTQKYTAAFDLIKKVSKPFS